MLLKIFLPQRAQRDAKKKNAFLAFLGVLSGEILLFFYRKGRKETQSRKWWALPTLRKISHFLSLICNTVGWALPTIKWLSL
jgi:hypothetical protein